MCFINIPVENVKFGIPVWVMIESSTAISVRGMIESSTVLSVRGTIESSTVIGGTNVPACFLSEK